LLLHRLGKIHAGNSATSSKVRCSANPIARTKADFQHMIGRLDIKLFDRPINPPTIDSKKKSREQA